MKTFKQAKKEVINQVARLAFGRWSQGSWMPWESSGIEVAAATLAICYDENAKKLEKSIGLQSMKVYEKMIKDNERA